ncbi:hypothetical protein GCM10027592_31890 [Spirosoma flavus]
MKNEPDPIDFFKHIILLDAHAITGYYQFYLYLNPPQYNIGLEKDEQTTIFYKANDAFHALMREEVKGDRFRVYFRELVDQYKRELRTQTIFNSVENSISSNKDYLNSKVREIYALVIACKDSRFTAEYVAYMKSALVEVGVDFLRLHKADFTTEEYHHFYNAFYDKQQNGAEEKLNADIYLLKNTQPEPSKKTRVRKKPVDSSLLTYKLKTASTKEVHLKIVQLEDIFYKLKGGNGASSYIKCNLYEFKSIFGLIKKKSIVSWYGELEELHALIHLLSSAGIIKDWNKWKIGTACFKIEDENINYNSFRTSVNPEKIAHIDSVIGPL